MSPKILIIHSHDPIRSSSLTGRPCHYAFIICIVENRSTQSRSLFIHKLQCFTSHGLLCFDTNGLGGRNDIRLVIMPLLILHSFVHPRSCHICWLPPNCSQITIL